MEQVRPLGADRPHEWVLLDLDGTLTDPYDGITRCVLHALAQLRVPPPEGAALRAVIGPPLQEGFPALGVPAEQVEDAIRLYRERYTEVGIYENRMYDGIPELLDDLRAAGHRLALATSKPDVFAQRVLEHFGIIDRFAVVGGATLDGARRHKADVVAHVLEATGSADAVMVGDRAQDVQGARAHGLRCVGVRWGYAEPGELEAAGAEPIVETPAELLAVLTAGGRRPSGRR